MLLVEAGWKALGLSTGAAALTDFSLIPWEARSSAAVGLLRLRTYFSGGKSLTNGFMFSIRLPRMLIWKEGKRGRHVTVH